MISYEPAVNSVDTPDGQSFIGLKVDDVIQFGFYEQDNNTVNGKEDIEWKVIDKDNDPQQAKEYITDIIESLLLEENYYLNEKNYIDPHYLEKEDSELTPEMRTVAVDWLVLIHHKIFKFQENTLFLTIQIFDRYLSKIDLNTNSELFRSSG